MKIYIKGGPWTNLEDEILKAAVMKYGKNQWDRIASLLPRKSAKQAKARWHGWLDPSIKKTDWTREEEEKLLHLVKMMPTQWRTIAPIVGRTPFQCIEHFEFLLDKYQERDKEYDEGDDPRKLQPGEIDQQAEHKAPLPDPIDMDEDEKEMLSEAKARIANTMGKKAKRRARERELEHQRRLSQIKKQRELKSTGIYVVRDSVSRKRKMKRTFKKINFLEEIPFQRRAPSGYFDTSTEKESGADTLRNTAIDRTIQTVEGRANFMEEQRRRKQDRGKIESWKNRDLPTVLDHISAMNVPKMQKERASISLPSPQIGDEDLRQLSKVGFVAPGGGSGGKSVTNRLLSDYSSATPYRTGNTPAPLKGGPSLSLRTPHQADHLKEQTQHINRLRKIQTPFMSGGSGSAEVPISEAKNVFNVDRDQMITRHSTIGKRLQTPNPFKQAISTPSGRTPGPGTGTGFRGNTVRNTPFRDELRINKPTAMIDDGEDEEELTAKQRRKALRTRQKRLRASLRAQFRTQLPRPESSGYSFRPVFPGGVERDGPSSDEEEDEEELGRRAAEARAKRAAGLRRMRSGVVKRGLYVPEVANNSFFDGEGGPGQKEGQAREVERLILGEMKRLVLFDGKYYGSGSGNNSKKKKRKKKRRNKMRDDESEEEEEEEEEEEISEEQELFLSEFSVSEIQDARRMIEGELGGTAASLLPSADVFCRVWDRAASAVYGGEGVMRRGYEKYVRAMYGRTRNEIEELELEVGQLGKRAISSISRKMDRIGTVSGNLDSSFLKLDSFGTVSQLEGFAMPKRVGEMRAEIERKKEQNEKLQNTFVQLKEEERRVRDFAWDDEKMKDDEEEEKKDGEKMMDDGEDQD